MMQRQCQHRSPARARRVQPREAPSPLPSRSAVATSSASRRRSISIASPARSPRSTEPIVPGPPAPGGIVFVGSSTIRLWTTLAEDFAGLPVLNRGFGGSTFPEALHYLQPTVVRYQPRTVVVYEGDNDLAAGRTPQQVADDYRAFVRGVRDSLPNARIVFLAIKPSPSRWKLESQQLRGQPARARDRVDGSAADLRRRRHADARSPAVRAPSSIAPTACT